MKAITIRKIDDSTYDKLKQKSRQKGLSINKFVIGCIEETVGGRKKLEHNDFDEFFGSWNRRDHEAVNRASRQNRKIDRDIWK